MKPATQPTSPIFENKLIEEHVRQLAGDQPIAAFGTKGLNDLLGGVYPALNVVIGATPGSGKTTLALAEADDLAAKGHIVVYVSGELPGYKLVSKSLSRLSMGQLELSDVTAAASKQHPKHSIFVSALDAYRNRIAPNLCITGPLGITDLGRLVGDIIRERGQIPILFLDYLQLLATAGSVDPFVDERLAIAAYVKGLREIANCYGAPIYALSSITRSAYGSKKPNIGVFGGTASIDYSFDAAILLSEEEDKDFPFGCQTGKPVSLTALKNRYGSLGTAHLSFDGAHATFHDRNQPIA